MKRILAALDATPMSARVLDAAIAVARAEGATICAVRAVEPHIPVALPGVWAPPPPDDVRLIAQVAETSLQRAFAAVPAELRDVATVEIGTPWRVIYEAARAYDVDLIVLGAHAHGFAARALGTTAARVVNHADRPVLVVRPRPVQPHPEAGAR